MKNETRVVREDGTSCCGRTRWSICSKKLSCNVIPWSSVGAIRSPCATSNMTSMQLAGFAYVRPSSAMFVGERLSYDLWQKLFRTKQDDVRGPSQMNECQTHAWIMYGFRTNKSCRCLLYQIKLLKDDNCTLNSQIGIKIKFRICMFRRVYFARSSPRVLWLRVFLIGLVNTC